MTPDQAAAADALRDQLAWWGTSLRDADSALTRVMAGSQATVPLTAVRQKVEHLAHLAATAYPKVQDAPEVQR